MLAIQQHRYGSAEELYMGECATPEPGPGELLVRVKAAGVNRADLLQREGKYPPPTGVTDVLGLEVAGIVVKTGEAAEGFAVGDRVFGLLPGGGYAEYAAAPATLFRAMPEEWSFEMAAAVPEVFLTAFQSLNWLAKLKKGETVLVHAGGSGVGTAAIQIAKAMGARVAITASAGKLNGCLELGADLAFDYTIPGLWEEMKEKTGGVDVILDPVGAVYFGGNLEILRTDGRLVMLSGMGGVKAGEVFVGQIIFKRLSILGTTLRSRTKAYQSALWDDFWSFALPKFNEGGLKPVLDCIFDWSEVREAHGYVEAGRNIGKVIMRVG